VAVAMLPASLEKPSGKRSVLLDSPVSRSLEFPSETTPGEPLQRHI
jgi:hypothetical protein